MSADAVKGAYDEVTATLKEPHMNQTVALKNGKIVGYSEVGDAAGAAVFMFLGLAGHRYLNLWFEALAKRHKLRVFVIERPGKGLSWRLGPAELNVLEWPGVVEEVAKLLNIQRFSIVGHSAGTIFSLACALQIEQHIVGPICLISPWTSLDVVGSNPRLQKVRRWPGYLIRSGIQMFQPLGFYFSSGTDPEAVIGQMEKHLSFTEAAALKEPHNFAIWKHAREAARREAGAQGYIVDVMMCLETYQAFGFAYTDVQRPVHIFHGDRDTMVPLAACEWMRDTMPDCKLTVFKAGTHKLIADNTMLDQLFGLLAQAHADTG